MTRKYGISINSEGNVVCAALCRSPSTWKLKNVRQWNSQSFVKNYLLLNRAIHLGLQCHWIRTPPSDTRDLVLSSEEPSFTVCTNRIECDHFSDVLRNNLDAVFPDDALLLTLPLHFIENVSPSFISIFNEGSTIKIGVILQATLIVVFNVKATSHRELDGHIGRIERYLHTVLPEVPPLETQYVINDIDFYDCSAVGAERVPCGSDDSAVLKAMGCALCDIAPGVPRLCGPTFESRFRRIRTLVLYGALLVSLIGVMLTATLFAVGWHFNLKVADAKKNYQDILANNSEIRELIAVGDRLSGQIMRLNQRASRRTTWGPFLQSIGSLRPSGLFFERLGSEPLQGPDAKIRIAMAGWCENETIATSFIKALKGKPFLSDVTLASMERINGQQPACRFKILCVLSTLKN